MLAIPRRAALVAIAVLVAAASAASFAESYRGLYDWAAGHGLAGTWAVIWPVQVDVFIAVGELALFVALADRWAPRSRAAAWTVTGIGLAVSVAGNVGHVASRSVPARVTAAVPPLAAALALAVALGVLKRVVEAHHEEGGGEVPSSSLHAARMRLKVAAEHGFKVTPNDTQERFGLTRAAARGLHAEFAPKEAPAGTPPIPAGVLNGQAHG